tara:strand:- start:910 stop:1407 length:498 start_codon:yes stop_codon:yes gene_type:complete
MKYSIVLIILFYLNNYVLFGEDYFIDNNGKRTIITEHNYTDKSFFRAFKIEGSFTDNFGNYGNWEAFVTTFISEGKVAKLDFSNMFTYQNKNKFYLQGYRQEGTDVGAGVGKAIIVYPDKSFQNLSNSKCVYSVKFFDETFFGKMKCQINPKGIKELKNIQEKSN